MTARRRFASRLLATFVSTLVLASPIWAQESGGIAGVVSDATGGVLPGVTVEATSPALIEKVRIATTDGEGRYIVALRPGTYTVSFKLPGFASAERKDVTLTSGFTATINAELRPGDLQETVTATGASLKWTPERSARVPGDSWKFGVGRVGL